MFAAWKLITSFIPAKLIYALVAGAVVLSIFYFGFRHYSDMVDDIAMLNADKAKLEVSVKLQKQTIQVKDEAIDKWEAAQKELIATIEAMAEVSAAATAETRKINDLFADHNLSELSKRKPGLIEKRINRGSARSDRLLYCASGGAGRDCDKQNEGAPGEAEAPKTKAH